MNPRVNLKLLVMVGQKFVMVGQKFVMVGQETVMVGQMPAHAHPWLRHWARVLIHFSVYKCNIYMHS